MSFIVALALPVLLCLLMAAGSTLLWARELPSPLLFATTAFLSTLGLHRVILGVAEFTKVFTAGGYILEAKPQPTVAELVSEAINTETLVVCALLVVLSVPLLLVLRAAIARG